MAVALYNGGLYSDDLTLDESHHQARAYRECAQWLEFLALEGKAARTVADYERSIAKLLRNNMTRPIERYTDDVFVTGLNSHPPGSRRPVRAHYQSFCRWLVLTGRLDRNPMERVPKLQGPKQKVIDIFTDEECALLEGGPIQNSIILTLMLHCGLRRSEIIKLQRKHIDTVHEMQLVVYRGKGAKDRIIPFGEHVARRMATFDLIERLNPDDYIVWTRPGGKRITHANRSTAAGFSVRYGKWVAEAGVRYRNPHVCRHTFAVRWLRRGGRLEVLSMVMGHSSITTTADAYGHLDQSDARADLLRIEAYKTVEQMKAKQVAVARDVGSEEVARWIEDNT